MADKPKQTEGIARREVLRRSAAASVATAVGVSAFSGGALAHECPRTPGYWKNHDWPGTGLENVNEALPGVTFGSVAEGQAYLSRSTDGDKGVIMAHHLIATVLNFQNQGSFPDPCVDTEVVDVTGDGDPETIREVKRLAQDWLEASAFPGEQPTWTVAGATVEDGEVVKDALDDFNNTRLGLDCDCE